MPIEVLDRTLEIGDSKYHVKIIPLGKQYFIWVGDTNAEFDDMHYTMPCKYTDGTTSCTSHILGESDSVGVDISQKLATKFQIPMFVSVNILDMSDVIRLQIQKCLFTVIEKIITTQ